MILATRSTSNSSDAVSGNQSIKGVTHATPVSLHGPTAGANAMPIASPLDFVELINDLATALKQELPKFDAEADNLYVVHLGLGETEFSFIHTPRSEPSVFTVFCRLGALPKDAAPAMKRALEINLLTASSQGGILGIDPASGEMYLTVRAHLDEVTSPIMLAMVGLMARQAEEWKKTHFLDTAPESQRLAQDAAFMTKGV